MTRFAFIDREKAHHDVAALCRLLKVSRSGFYAWLSRPPSALVVADEVLTTQIRTAFDDNRRVYGAPRIHAELADAGVHVGRKRDRPADARRPRSSAVTGASGRSRSPGRTREPRSAPDRVDRKFVATHAEPAVGGRRDLRADRAGLALPGLRHRRVQPDGDRLVDGLPPQDRPGRRRGDHGGAPPG